MDVGRERRGLPAADYYYRRTVGGRDLLPAMGAGVVLGLAGFYIARLMLQRVPMVREPGLPFFGARGELPSLPIRPAVRD